jgi:hypothetical protein
LYFKTKHLTDANCASSTPETDAPTTATHSTLKTARVAGLLRPEGHDCKKAKERACGIGKIPSTCNQK